MWRQALLPQPKPHADRMKKHFDRPKLFKVDISRMGDEWRCEDVGRELGLDCKGVSYEGGKKEMLFIGTQEKEDILRQRLEGI